MTPFRRGPDGLFVAELSPLEADLITALTAELAGALLDRDDPARGRLLPDAYPGDTAASGEFRRLTEHDLAARKAGHAATMAATAGAGGQVRLDAAQAQDWLRGLTDVRLMLAIRLGIHDDGDEPQAGDDRGRALAVAYGWLGWVQESLVEALEERE